MFLEDVRHETEWIFSEETTSILDRNDLTVGSEEFRLESARTNGSDEGVVFVEIFTSSTCFLEEYLREKRLSV